MSIQVIELADAIKEKGRRSTGELPPLLERAEEFGRDETLTPLSRALAWRAAGNALQLMNRFESALARYDCAISFLQDTASPKQTEELGRTLHAKVGLLIFTSRFDEALKCAAQSRSIFEGMGDRHRLARLDVNLSHLYHRLDRHPMVLECAERALPVLREINDCEGLMAASLNAAVASTVMHQFELAETRYHEALVLAGKLGLASVARQCRYNIAYLEYLAGNSSGALDKIVSLRSEFAAAAEERHVCLCWLDEAEILLEIGNIHGAQDAARRAKHAALSLDLGFEAGKALLFEAAALLRIERRSDAQPLLDEATQYFAKEQNGVWKALAKLQAALFNTGNADHIDRALADARMARQLLENSGLPHRLALADIVIGCIERTRGNSEGSIRAFQSALAISASAQSEWMEFHASYELGISLMPGEPEQSTALLQRAERMLDSLWRRLGSDDLKLAFLHDRENVYTYLVPQTVKQSHAAGFELSDKSRSRVLAERLSAGNPRLASIQAQLAPNEMLLEYFVAGNDLTVFAVTASTFECIQRRGVIDVIHDHCRNMERHLASCSVKWERLSPVHDQLLATADHHLQALYRELIAPIDVVLPERIIIVPHGFLHGIPFHALHSGTEYLIDRHEVVYSPSAALYCSPQTRRFEAPPLFIAFTDGIETSAIDEVESAARRFSGVVVLINPKMSALREALGSPRSLVHIAGHAGIDTIGGTLSWIETPEGRLSGGDLTGMSIQARTIVITGCQTARREICPGDEWQGLMRAFYLAGASTIVSAFWDIRDESARQFSSEFYHYFNGTNAPDAVRKASESIRSLWRHPYFWAGFGAFMRNER